MTEHKTIFCMNETCLIEFAPDGPSKFCSPRCQRQHVNRQRRTAKLQALRCEWCGGQIGNAKTLSKKYCSVKCNGAANRYRREKREGRYEITETTKRMRKRIVDSAA